MLSFALYRRLRGRPENTGKTGLYVFTCFSWGGGRGDGRRIHHIGGTRRRGKLSALFIPVVIAADPIFRVEGAPVLSSKRRSKVLFDDDSCHPIPGLLEALLHHRDDYQLCLQPW
jgi:hypothetical protein